MSIHQEDATPSVLTAARNYKHRLDLQLRRRLFDSFAECEMGSEVSERVARNSQNLRAVGRLGFRYHQRPQSYDYHVFGQPPCEHVFDKEQVSVCTIDVYKGRSDLRLAVLKIHGLIS